MSLKHGLVLLLYKAVAFLVLMAIALAVMLVCGIFIWFPIGFFGFYVLGLTEINAISIMYMTFSLGVAGMAGNRVFRYLETTKWFQLLNVIFEFPFFEYLRAKRD